MRPSVTLQMKFINDKQLLKVVVSKSESNVCGIFLLSEKEKKRYNTANGVILILI